MRDVVMPEDRSIRNIPVPPNRRRAPLDSAPVTPPPPPSHIRRMPQYANEPSPKGSSRRIWILAALSGAILFAIGAAMLFQGAHVEVAPRTETVTLPGVLTASLDAPIGALPFETVTATQLGDRKVPASGEQKIERRASGTITVYNEYNTQIQRLIKNTRFEAPNGKIYRIDQSIVIPAATKGSDGTLIPGTIDVVVYADSPGVEYNADPISRFTIPGFKGDPRYDKFYAKSKTPMTGGFVGTEKVVSQNDLAAAKSGIEAELATKLSAALTEALPQGYVLVTGSERTSYEALPQQADGSDAVISIRGIISGAIIKEAHLASAIAKETLGGNYSGEAVLFADAKAVTLEGRSKVEPGVQTITFAATSPVTLVFQIDTGAIAKALAGTSEANFKETVEQTQPSVADATASMRPFWKSVFPTDPESISVEIVTGDN